MLQEGRAFRIDCMLGALWILRWAFLLIWDLGYFWLLAVHPVWVEEGCSTFGGGFMGASGSC